MSAEPAQSASLAQLSDAWGRFGCAVCSHVPSQFAHEGARIELHHILPRSQGGSDDQDNLMGLCGELCEQRCHWRVTTNRMTISWSANVSCWVWSDGDTVGLCRPLDPALLAEAGLGNKLVASKETLHRRFAAQLPVERLPENVATEHGRVGAELRFHIARDLHDTAQKAWMSLALVVQYAIAHGDHIQLGFETIGMWADAMGISKPTMSKLRSVGRIFEGAWTELPEADQRALSIDALYLASRMVIMGHWDKERALHEAVAKPVHVLYGDTLLAKGTRHRCICPTCGYFHFKKLEPPLE